MQRRDFIVNAITSTAAVAALALTPSPTRKQPEPETVATELYAVVFQPSGEVMKGCEAVSIQQVQAAVDTYNSHMTGRSESRATLVPVKVVRA